MKKITTLIIALFIISATILTGCSSDNTNDIRNSLSNSISETLNKEITKSDIWFSTEKKNEDTLMINYFVSKPYLIPILAEQINPTLEEYGKSSDFFLLIQCEKPETLWDSSDGKFGTFSVKGKVDPSPYSINDLKEYYSKQIEENWK